MKIPYYIVDNLWKSQKIVDNYRKKVLMHMFILIIIEEKKGNSKKDVLGLSKTLLICGALLAFALFVINYLVTELGKTVDSVILFPVSSALSIGITAIIGWLVFKEKLTIKNFIGLIVGLLGIIVIGIF